MGTVWEGHDELLGREVAVKEVRFPPELGDRAMADLRERTLREARASARLSHPNVVTTYDVVEEDGRPWIVMELLPTRSLSEVLREDGPLPPHRVAEIGLGRARRAGVGPCAGRRAPRREAEQRARHQGRARRPHRLRHRHRRPATRR